MQQFNPLVSIITPSLNQGQYIEHTILSVLNQSYNNLEYIIMDGGSTDNTEMIINKYKHDKRLQCFYGKDGGQYDAINKGLKIASGQIIGYINSDDIYYPQALENAVENFRSKPNIDVLYGDYIFIDENNFIIPFKPFVRKFEKKWLMRYDFINPSATFISSRVIKEGFFLNPGISHFGDWDWYLRMVQKDKIFYHLEKITCYFRVHKNSKTLTMSRKKIREQRLMISHRYNIDIRKMVLFDDVIFPWYSRFAKLIDILRKKTPTLAIK
jgi:glycosyltransferase involved in cell wall biosynthesis